MKNNQSKDDKMKEFLKSQVRANLLEIGRKLVVEKTADFLTARKLSEFSNCSVGTIYNQFASMDELILEINLKTLDDFYVVLQKILLDSSPYVNINRYVDVFSSFVISNSNLWILLFNSHLNNQVALPFYYRKTVKRIEKLFASQLSLMFGEMKYAEKKMASQVLEMSIFSLSGFIATKSYNNLKNLDEKNICKLLLNTYLAGLASLGRVR